MPKCRHQLRPSRMPPGKDDFELGNRKQHGPHGFLPIRLESIESKPGQTRLKLSLGLRLPLEKVQVS